MVSDWIEVCASRDLSDERGIAVLAGDQPIALFRVEGSLYAVGHTDPRTESNTIARGLVGESDGRPFVAAPLHKERYDLATGECLDAEGCELPVFPVTERDGNVLVNPNVTSR